MQDALGVDGAFARVGDVDPHRQQQYLERSIEFLKRQQRDVLTSLHEEIDALKRENKGGCELNVLHPVLVQVEHTTQIKK